MSRPDRPNVVFFFVDDMGYGDASCLNPEGKIHTPQIDRLAREGMIFTDAHSTSAVCSPSRYGVLTGRYNWRSTLQQGIVGLYGDSLIAEDRLTAPAYLKSQGYHTACIGKWHLGMSWDFEAEEVTFCPKRGFFAEPDAPGADMEATPEQRAAWEEAFSKPVKGGPRKAGFDYYFGTDVPNWPPYCFIENDRTVGIPSEFLPAGLLGNNQASHQGPAMAGWHFEQLLPTFAGKADEYIAARAAADAPFFLYFASTSPHTPLAVNKEWQGKSGLGNRYADFVMETDDIFGQVLDSLDKHGVADNTLVIFASDNGCAHYVGAKEMEAQGHYPSAHLRGYKSDAWDGGHRIPLVARWPGVIEPGRQCDELVCLSDFFATVVEALGGTLPDNAGEDSISLMPHFRGEGRPTRETVVHHSISGKFALRDKTWKVVLCPGSGGWCLPDGEAVKDGLPLVQLYNMTDDPGETTNLVDDEPERVRALIAELKTIVAQGRSTSGTPQANDAEVDIWKLHTLPGVTEADLDDY